MNTIHLKKNHLSLFLLSLALSCAHPQQAQTLKTAQEEKPRPVYLEPTALPKGGGLSPPPTRGSVEDQRDFDALLKAQKTRTPEECKRAVSEEDVNLANFYGPAYGPLSAAETDRLGTFFENVRKETRFFSKLIKADWNRPRPYDANPAVIPCIRKETSTAYPSGHATAARTFAKILELIHPEKKTAIRKREKELVQDRLIGGVHHPSDLRAGLKLGNVLFRELMKSPKFLSELEAEKKKVY